MLSLCLLNCVTWCMVAAQTIAPYPHSGSHQNARSACESIAHSFKAPDTTINFAAYIRAGTNLTFGPPYNETCARPSQLVTTDLCRVSMAVSTSNRSGITLEAWLPTNWTGRFMSTGNGGLDGCIHYEDVAYGTANGFATVGANNGHNGTGGEAFYMNEDVVTDFAWRSLHTGVVVGKEITKAYYRRDFTKSYYLGCSTGGREGFKMVQDFPDDFDGVLAGAPALAFNNLSSWSGHFLLLTGTNESASYLPYSKWLAVHQAIFDQCDTIDGAADGILEDPLLCDFIPEVMQCPSNTTDTSTCLTSRQVETVRGVFSPYYGVNGTLVFPAMQPGSEETAYYVYYTGEPFPYTLDWFRYAILEDPTWSAFDLSPELAAYAHAKNPGDIETWKGDLSAFKNRGGKLLHYHGQADPIITSDNSPRYYQHVSRTMGMPPVELDDFYRFFRISGMGHCEGGDGAWQIGQSAAGAEGTPDDPQNNVLQRMIDWVENGNAPVSVTGTKYVNDTVSLGVDFVRNHCKYPLRNQCMDSADYKNASAWECVL